MTKEAKKCWGNLYSIYPTTDEKIIQERTIRMVISNWMYNSLLEDDLNRVKLRHQIYAYYRPEQQIFVIDSPIVIKVVLDSINPEARVNTHDLKDKL